MKAILLVFIILYHLLHRTCFYNNLIIAMQHKYLSLPLHTYHYSYSAFVTVELAFRLLKDKATAWLTMTKVGYNLKNVFLTIIVDHIPCGENADSLPDAQLVPPQVKPQQQTTGGGGAQPGSSVPGPSPIGPGQSPIGHPPASLQGPLSPPPFNSSGQPSHINYQVTLDIWLAVLIFFYLHQRILFS